jgi:hypothetical protein
MAKEGPQNNLVIDELVSWQSHIDDTGLMLNSYGSDRFWATVSQRLGGRYIGRDGAPDLTELLIELEPGVALRLYTDPLDQPLEEGHTPLIRYEFVALTDGN